MLTKVRGVDGTHPSTLERHPHPIQRERPLLLATLAAPLDPRAVEFAVGCVLESGHPLVMAGFVEVTPGWGATLPAPQLDAMLQPAIDQVSSLVSRLQVLKVQSPRPLRAILDVTDEVDAGLLAFGPDPTRIRPRRYRHATRFLSDRAPCLLWLAETSAISA